MWECCSQEEARPLVAITRRDICDRFCVGLAVLALVRVGAAFASDPASVAEGSGRPQPNDSLRSPSVAASWFTIPENYAIPGVPETKTFSATEFRPRGPTLFNSEHTLNVTDESLMSDTPVWQRLADFRTLGRVRVLTLWQSSANSVSLQAGKKGTPSLQWTAHLFSHNPGSTGLLDRLFPVSLGGVGTAHGVPHAVTSTPAVKGTVPTSSAHLAPVTP